MKNDKSTRVIVQVTVPTGPPENPEGTSVVYSEDETISRRKSTRRATRRCMNAILTHMLLDGLQ